MPSPHYTGLLNAWHANISFKKHDRHLKKTKITLKKIKTLKNNKYLKKNEKLP